MFGAYWGMPRPALRLTLTKKERTSLRKLLAGGIQPVRVVLHALSLLWLDSGETAPQIAERLPVSAQTVRNLIRRYGEGGLDRALYDKARPGAQLLLDERQQQRVVALACSDPPPGRARWTVRLIAEEAVKRKILPAVGRETIRILLLNHDLKPWREKNVVRTEAR